MSLPIRARAAVLVLFLCCAALLGSARQAGAAPSPADESSFVAAVNARRTNAGLPALTVDTELTDAARSWAEQMAANGRISHAPDITDGITAYWLKVGENVGTGPTVSAVMDAFVGSPAHNANIMDPAFTHIGVGVVWSGSALYTVHRFMQLGSSPATTAPPAPATTAPPATAAPQTTAPPVAPPAATTTTARPNVATSQPPRFPVATTTPGSTSGTSPTTTTTAAPATTTTLPPFSTQAATDRDRTLRVFDALRGATS